MFIPFLAKFSRLFYLIVGFGLIIFLGALRFLTGPEYAFSLFYVLPICMITWFVGKTWGVAASLTGALTWLLADLQMSEYFANPFVPVINETLRLSLFLVVTYILAELKKALDYQKKLAMTDHLTGISNRRAFFELTGRELNRARLGQYPITAVFLDLDKFKDVNDRFGHHTGDTLLRNVAETLTKNTREKDIVARVGGDEFVLLLPDTGEEKARSILPRLRDDLDRMMAANGWPVGISLGVVTFSTAPATIDEIIKKADTLMYSAKQGGKWLAQEIVNG